MPQLSPAFPGSPIPPQRMSFSPVCPPSSFLLQFCPHLDPLPGFSSTLLPSPFLCPSSTRSSPLRTMLLPRPQGAPQGERHLEPTTRTPDSSCVTLNTPAAPLSLHSLSKRGWELKLPGGL